MKQWPIFIILTVILLWIEPHYVQASPQGNTDQTNVSEELINKGLEQVDLEELKEFWDEIMVEYGVFLPEGQKGNLIDFVSGEKTFFKRLVFRFFKICFS